MEMTRQDAQVAPARQAERLVVYISCPQRRPDGHERMTLSALASRLAALKGLEFGGDYEHGECAASSCYFVPDESLCDLGLARGLGIATEHDLFGGVVPHSYVATKAITHPLHEGAQQAPPEWRPGFAHAVRDVVLPGYSVFSLADARAAGAALLRHGRVRLKPCGGVGGSGQEVAADAAQLERLLGEYDAATLACEGLVLERNLHRVQTHSVGQVRCGRLLASYYGSQGLTRNNRGEEVYGGSDLVVVRGDFDALQGLRLEPEMQTAIAQARQYHQAALAGFPGMFASRANYDIAQGVDDSGQWHSGVLEQSWRIGGASGAEVAALEAFQAEPALRAVRAATVEVYGEGPRLPAGARLIYQGIDPRIGPLTKYSLLQAHAYP